MFKSLPMVGVLMLLMVGVASAAGSWYIMGNDYVHIPGQPNTDNTNYPPFAETLTQRAFVVEQDCLDALSNHRKSKILIFKSDSNGTYQSTSTGAALKSERIANATCQLMP